MSEPLHSARDGQRLEGQPAGEQEGVSSGPGHLVAASPGLSLLALISPRDHRPGAKTVDCGCESVPADSSPGLSATIPGSWPQAG